MMNISPNDLREMIDISDMPLFITTGKVITYQKPLKVTCKELIEMIDELTTRKEQVTNAQECLTERLNEFLNRD